MFRSAVVAVMAALMTFGKQLGFLLIQDNRYFFLWRFSDSVGVLLDIVILAAVLVGISVLSRKVLLLERLWNRVLILMLVSGALTLLPVWLLPPLSLNAYRLGVVAIVVVVASFF